MEFGIPFIIFILASSIRGKWKFEVIGSLAVAVKEEERRRKKKKKKLTPFVWIVKFDTCQNFK